MPLSSQNVSKYAEFEGELDELMVTLKQMFKEGAVRVTLRRQGPMNFQIYWS